MDLDVDVEVVRDVDGARVPDFMGILDDPEYDGILELDDDDAGALEFWVPACFGLVTRDFGTAICCVVVG